MFNIYKKNFFCLIFSKLISLPIIPENEIVLLDY
jgi:hypothetical protein